MRRRDLIPNRHNTPQMLELNGQTEGREMQKLSPECLAKLLSAAFPPSATSWYQATDEVRDMCREARVLAGVAESNAVNFRRFSSPQQWNQHGVDGILHFYEMLAEPEQEEFCFRFTEVLTSAISSQRGLTTNNAGIVVDSNELLEALRSVMPESIKYQVQLVNLGLAKGSVESES